MVRFYVRDRIPEAEKSALLEGSYSFPALDRRLDMGNHMRVGCFFPAANHGEGRRKKSNTWKKRTKKSAHSLCTFYLERVAREGSLGSNDTTLSRNPIPTIANRRWRKKKRGDGAGEEWERKEGRKSSSN
jgi:hypothetical protein